MKRQRAFSALFSLAALLVLAYFPRPAVAGEGAAPAAGGMVEKIYDLAELPALPAPDQNTALCFHPTTPIISNWPSLPGSSFFPDNGDLARDLRRLVPASWEEPAVLELLQGPRPGLLVRQTPEVQAEISRTLALWRAAIQPLTIEVFLAPLPAAEVRELAGAAVLDAEQLARFRQLLAGEHGFLLSRLETVAGRSVADVSISTLDAARGLNVALAENTPALVTPDVGEATRGFKVEARLPTRNGGGTLLLLQVEEVQLASRGKRACAQGAEIELFENDFDLLDVTLFCPDGQLVFAGALAVSGLGRPAAVFVRCTAAARAAAPAAEEGGARLFDLSPLLFGEVNRPRCSLNLSSEIIEVAAAGGEPELLPASFPFLLDEQIVQYLQERFAAGGPAAELFAATLPGTQQLLVRAADPERLATAWSAVETPLRRSWRSLRAEILVLGIPQAALAGPALDGFAPADLANLAAQARAGDEAEVLAEFIMPAMDGGEGAYAIRVAQRDCVRGFNVAVAEGSTPVQTPDICRIGEVVEAWVAPRLGPGGAQVAISGEVKYVRALPRERTPPAGGEAGVEQGLDLYEMRCCRFVRQFEGAAGQYLLLGLDAQAYAPEGRAVVALVRVEPFGN